MITTKSISPIIALVIALLVGTLGFVAGIKYQETKGAQSFRTNMFNRGMMNGNFEGPGGLINSDNVRGGSMPVQGGNRQNGMMLRPLTGEILSKDDKSITIKLTDGSSKIVLISTVTPVAKSVTGSATDIVVGEKVAIFGTVNSDGSYTAQNVQLNPQFWQSVSPTQAPTPTTTQ